MTDEEIRALLEDPELIEKFTEDFIREQEEEHAKAPKCYCGYRCDPPFGDSKRCIICLSKPTAEDMRMIFY